MNIRTIIVLLVLSAVCIGPIPRADAAAAKSTEAAKPGTGNKEKQFHLKPGAEQKVCLTCHPAFEDVLKRKYVHTPVRTPGCPACHSPHTSNFPKQLSAEGASSVSPAMPGSCR